MKQLCCVLGDVMSLLCAMLGYIEYYRLAKTVTLQKLV